MSLKVDFTRREEEVLVELVQHYPHIYNPGNLMYKDSKVKEDSWDEIAERVGRPAEECKWRWKNLKDSYVKRKRKGILEGPGTTYWHLATPLKFLDQVEFKQRTVTSSSQKPVVGETDTSNEDVEFIDICQVEPEPFATTTKRRAPGAPADKNAKRKRTRNRHKTIRLPPVTKVSADLIEPVETITVLPVTDIVEVEHDNPQLVQIKQMPQMPVIQLPQTDYNDSAGNADDHVEVFFRSVALSVKAFPKHLINEAKLRTLQMLVELESKQVTNNHGFIIAPNYSGIITFDGSNGIGSNSNPTSS